MLKTADLWHFNINTSIQALIIGKMYSSTTDRSIYNTSAQINDFLLFAAKQFSSIDSLSHPFHDLLFNLLTHYYSVPNAIVLTSTFIDVSSDTKLEVLTAVLPVHDTVSPSK